MKGIQVLFFVALGCYAVLGQAKAKTFYATISRYECGDACYLIVKDAKGNERSGLCAASFCQQLDEDIEKWQGVRVKITPGRGIVTDGDGGSGVPVTTFEKIELR